MRRYLLVLVAATAWFGTSGACAAEVASGMHEWIATHFGALGDRLDLAPTPAFGFTYGGQPQSQVLDRAERKRISRSLDKDRLEHVIAYSDPETGLLVRCVATEYKDFPAVEWVLHFENKGQKDTPVLQDIHAIDTTFVSGAAEGVFKLFYSRGSHEQAQDFAPTEASIDESVRLTPYGGRSSDGVMPFFRFSGPDGSNTIMAIGWTGQWAAAFVKKDSRTLAVKAGMERTNLVLHPGESIRTPAILLLFGPSGDPLKAHNAFRRLMLKHYSPRPDGKPFVPPIAASPHGTIGFTDSTEANMVQTIQNLATHKFPVDTYWIDAGWNGEQKEWARAVGTWTANAERYPKGLKPVADAAHEQGMRFLLWCEPERVMRDTWLFLNHRDWLLAPAELPKELQYQANDGFHLLDLGNPEALAWTKKTFSDLIKEVGIDIYRQDFNMTPLYFWRNGEAPERQGMNEIRHVTGLYDFWDTLCREHPELLIDNCASGGRRIDFEVMRRALTLFRSDYCWEPVGTQAMNYGISFWMPVTGVGAISVKPYDFRSGMGTHLSLALDYGDKSQVWDGATAMLQQHQRIRDLFSADYYPLTPYSLDKDKWIAWQYHSPEKGEGIVLGFRRDASPAADLNVKLGGLEPGRTYVVEDMDSGTKTEILGEKLAQEGLALHAAESPGSTLLHYTERK